MACQIVQATPSSSTLRRSRKAGRGMGAAGRALGKGSSSSRLARTRIGSRAEAVGSRRSGSRTGWMPWGAFDQGSRRPMDVRVEIRDTEAWAPRSLVPARNPG